MHGAAPHEKLEVNIPRRGATIPNPKRQPGTFANASSLITGRGKRRDKLSEVISWE
jgi:hypothetical protein